MSSKYKARIASFLHTMTESPVNLNDYYEPSRKKLDDLVKLQDRRDHMVFRAPRCDKDIKEEMK